MPRNYFDEIRKYLTATQDVKIELSQDSLVSPSRCTGARPRRRVGVDDALPLLVRRRSCTTRRDARTDVLLLDLARSLVDLRPRRPQIMFVRELTRTKSFGCRAVDYQTRKVGKESVVSVVSVPIDGGNHSENIVVSRCRGVLIAHLFFSSLSFPT